MKHYIALTKRFAKEHGVWKTSIAILQTLLINFGYKSPVSRLRQKIGVKIKAKTQGRVYSGIYQGMKCHSNKSWDKDDLSALLLGSYELHVQQKLKDWCAGNAIFIDIGAADGFHAIGLVNSGAAKRSICFEISKAGQKIIAQNALINGIMDSVEIHGEASEQSLGELLKGQIKSEDIVILIDIEGGEYGLLNERMLSLIKKYRIVLELHEFYADQRRQSEELINQLKNHFKIEVINRQSVNPHDYPILDDMTDNEKLLAFSESRPSKMRWLALTPLP